MTGAPAAARYRGADGTFLRRAGWAVLLAVRPDHPLVERCWERLGATDDLDDVLETVVAAGLRPVPAFAVVRETGTPRLVARGELRLVVDAADLRDAHHPQGWVDRPLPAAATVDVALGDGGADGPVGPALPLDAGVVAAAGVVLVLGPRADGRTPPATAGPGTEAGTATVRAPRARPTGRASEDTLPATFTTGRATEPGRPVTDATGSPPARAADAPRVLAAVCPAGHLTPAYAGLCRVCARPVPAQETFETTRPVLGRLVLPDGGSVLLDRGAVLGRAPYVPAGWVGARPHLVTLPDPDHDVSAQHVSVALDLWNVLVCDLGSTNGTALLDRDGRLTRLAPYAPTALGPGGAVVVAEVVTLPFEVLP